MFSVGDIVIYGSNGVFKITDIIQKSINGKLVDYYVLNPVRFENSTLFVPCQNEQLLKKMRYIHTSDEIKEILRTPFEEIIWNKNKNERLIQYREIITGTDCHEIIRLIRHLHSHSKLQESRGRRLHISDERILKEAEKVICDELSFALNIEQGEVIPLILD